MALEEIFRALEAEAQARCAEIRMSASEEADRITSDARRRCEELVREQLDKHAAPLEAKARRVVNDARMEARRDISYEREQQIVATFDAAREALASVRARGDYAQLFERLLDEALDNGRPASSVLVDEADVALAEKLMKARGLGAAVRGEIDTAGGVVVLTDADRVRHDNTAEARLLRVREASHERVGELLFG